MKNATERTISKIKSIVKAKGEEMTLSDFLKPELDYIIKVANLSYEDRKMATLYFLQGMKSVDVMDAIPWYSTNTFTRHRKIVTAIILKTANMIADYYDEEDED